MPAAWLLACGVAVALVHRRTAVGCKVRADRPSSWQNWKPDELRQFIADQLASCCRRSHNAIGQRWCCYLRYRVEPVASIWWRFWAVIVSLPN
jgi:hypothetical protein